MVTVRELYEYSKKILENPDSLDRDLAAAYYITQLVDSIAKIVYEHQQPNEPDEPPFSKPLFKKEK